MDFLFIFLLALAIDLLFGEFPRATHPVVWMGKLTSLLCRVCNPPKSPFIKGGFTQLLCGILITIVIVALFSLPVYFLLSFLHDFNTILYILLGAI
ncbi:MAG: cobalamin biosynthesis protein, partial [Dehalococcoidia bacterium]